MHSTSFQHARGVVLPAEQGSGYLQSRAPAKLGPGAQTAAVEQVYDSTFGSVLACSAVSDSTARSSINLN